MGKCSVQHLSTILNAIITSIGIKLTSCASWLDTWKNTYYYFFAILTKRIEIYSSLEKTTANLNLRGLLPKKWTLCPSKSFECSWLTMLHIRFSCTTQWFNNSVCNAMLTPTIVSVTMQCCYDIGYSPCAVPLF